MGATSGPSCWEIFLSKQEAVEETPSRRDKMAKSIETHQRRNYVKLITDVCVKFGTNPEVPMIAASYCHRFYAAKSMVCNDYFVSRPAWPFPSLGKRALVGSDPSELRAVKCPHYPMLLLCL